MPIRPESVKRRTVWINDEDWATITERAQSEGKNVSVFVRERALAPGRIASGAVRRTFAAADQDHHPVPTARK